MAEQGGQAYQVDPHRLERARWIEANERFIQTNTNIKPCPRCQVPTEKNGEKSGLVMHAFVTPKFQVCLCFVAVVVVFATKELHDTVIVDITAVLVN